MNERRRTLLFSKSNIPTKNGVYIESVDHEFYLTDDWNSANTANSIAVVTDECKFRMALTRADSTTYFSIVPDCINDWGNTLTSATSNSVAYVDYNGAYNTQQILNLQASTDYAAGWCDAYIFPDGETKGYLPAIGEWYMAIQNIDAIRNAFSALGYAAWEYNDVYWSSTLSGQRGMCEEFWGCHFEYGNLGKYYPQGKYHVRPFAPLE